MTYTLPWVAMPSSYFTRTRSAGQRDLSTRCLPEIGYRGPTETDGKQECVQGRKKSALYAWCTYFEIVVYSMDDEYSVLDQVCHRLLDMFEWLGYG